MAIGTDYFEAKQEKCRSFSYLVYVPYGTFFKGGCVRPSSMTGTTNLCNLASQCVRVFVLEKVRIH